MKFPLSLLQKNRKKLASQRIRDWNYLYTRHKPSYDWDEDEALPDFTKIKIDQSFNWCNFSIPIWTRFNDTQKYLEDYAVAGFKVETIRNVHRRIEGIHSKLVYVEHKPIPANYSHCELCTLRKLNKTEKREIRINFRHKCIVPLIPKEKQSFVLILVTMIIMYFRRFLSRNM